MLFIPFFLFFTQKKFFTTVKLGFITVMTAPIKVLSAPAQEIKKILYYHKIYENYKDLYKEVGFLKSRLIGIEELTRENTRLVNLLALSRDLVYSSVAANVVGRDPSYWNNSMIIDKGTEDGLKIGQPVIGSMGVVGKIVETSKRTAKVILLSDPQFSVSTLAKRTRESGLVSGTLGGKCRMRYIDPNANIRVGDEVITSKLSSSFPENILVGTIIDIVDNKTTGSVEAVISPAVSLSQLEDVLVILK